ncbi:Type I phosphodiesterase / nucleotide pyrophosphatase family protein [Aphelenchoides avenae]|nr:Type I phosphodiesterase / nucleotide pyrophosphatase family protein [Aphelenchus avenae]
MGDHGYDNRLRSMRALFGAYGPSVKRSKLVAPFQNIELYNLFTELMQLPYAAPNNGTKGLLYSIMKSPPALEETSMVDLPECSSIEMFKCGDGCRKFDVPKEDTKDQGTCHKLNRAQVPASYAEAEKSLCVVRFCNSTMVYDTTSNKVHCVESMLSAPIPNIDHRANCSIHLTASKANSAHDEEYYATGTEESSNSTLPPVDRCATMAHSRPSNTSWITFFSDDDYARYISQGQLHVPSGFLEGIHKHLLDLIRQYQRHYKRLIMFSGPVYDEDNDGLRDRISPKDGPKAPTHLFVILLRCSGPWHRSLRYCEDPERTRTLAFLLPLVENDFNCLFPVEYLFRNTARVRDIELLTGLEWFTNRDVYPLEIAFRLRTQINEQLWQLENVGT